MIRDDMIYGCCTSFDNYNLLIKHGYDRIILPATELMAMDEAAVIGVRKTLAEGPVKCSSLNSFCTPALILCGNGFDPAAIKSYCTRLASRAHLIGAEYIGVGAPKSRSVPEGFIRELAMAQFKQSLSILCAACAPYKITILLEAVCSLECNFITTTEEALAVVKALNTDNLALVFDTYHAFMMGEDARPLRQAITDIKLIHVAQNIDNKRHYLRRENLAEYQVFFDALRDAGFSGEVSVEAFYDDMDAQLDETLDIMKLLCTNSENKRRSLE